MKRIKNWIGRFSVEITAVFSQYPVTALVILLMAFVFVTFVEESRPLAKFLNHEGLEFLGCFGVGAFLLESKRVRGYRKGLGLVVAATAAVAFAWLLNLKSGVIAGIPAAEVTAKIPHWYIWYCLTFGIAGIYQNFRNSEKTVSEFMVKFIRNMAQIGIAAGILTAGIWFVCIIFIFLVLGTDDYGAAFRIGWFFCLSVLGTGFISSLIEMEKEVSPFFTKVVKYILLLPLLAAFIVIYIYILKIVITWNVPSNEIFRILSALFICGLPIWTMAAYFPQDSTLQRLAARLPYVFAPFLFLQGYAIYARVAANGVTPNRYLCVMLMLFELAYILIYWLRRNEIAWMLPILMGMTLISLVFPGINMYSVSRKSQQTYLSRYSGSQFSELKQEEKSRLVGAYYYLQGDFEGKKSAAELPVELRTAIENTGPYAFDEISGNQYVSRFYDLTDVDVSGFSYLTQVQYNEETDDKLLIDQVPLRTAEDNKNLTTVDLSQLIKKYADEERSGKVIPGSIPAQSVLLADSRALLLTSLVFTINEENQISDLFLSGFLLSK